MAVMDSMFVEGLQFGENTVSRHLQIAAHDIGIGAAHYNFGEPDEALKRVNSALNLLTLAKVKMLTEVERTQNA